MPTPKINYIELPAADIPAAKLFFSKVFGWEFENYGDEYVAFSQKSAGLDGGFYKSALKSDADAGAALVVFYSDDLAATQADVESAGGKIVKAIFSFPGGRRFHFCDPNGNEFAVWSDV